MFKYKVFIINHNLTQYALSNILGSAYCNTHFIFYFYSFYYFSYNFCGHLVKQENKKSVYGYLSVLCKDKSFSCNKIKFFCL